MNAWDKIGTRFMKQREGGSYHIAYHERGRYLKFYLCNCMPRIFGKHVGLKKIKNPQKGRR
jgi:hypothetical protein